MKKRDLVKLMLVTFLNIGIFLVFIMIGFVQTGTLYGIFLWSLFGFIIAVLVDCYYCPIWFKDYIDEFWEKNENKSV